MSGEGSSIFLQFLVDFYGCDSSILSLQDKLLDAFSESERFFSLMPLELQDAHQSCFRLVFSSSELSVWTDPQRQMLFLSVVLFHPIKIYPFLRTLKHKLRASRYVVMEIPRGQASNKPKGNSK